MGLFGIKGFMMAQKALKAHNEGRYEEAEAGYRAALDANAASARLVLGYATLLFRSDRFQECKDMLVKYQKLPDLSGEQKNQLITDYAACCFKLGDTDKAVSKLEQLYQKGATGLNYQTLGYLYVEKYAFDKAPEALKDAALLRRLVEKAAVKPAAGEETEEDTASASSEGAGIDVPAQPAEADPVAEWVAGVRKALDFNLEALDYDEDDSVCQDNMGQMWLRVLCDKEKARACFEKALSLKETQIDTLWFLSRYDLEEGKPDQAIERLQKAIDNGRFSPLNCHTKAEFQAEIDRIRREGV